MNLDQRKGFDRSNPEHQARITQYEKTLAASLRLADPADISTRKDDDDLSGIIAQVFDDMMQVLKGYVAK